MANTDRGKGLALLLALALLAGGSLAAQQTEKKESDRPKAAEGSKKKKKKSDAGQERAPASAREILSRVLRGYKNGLESLGVSSARSWIDAPRFYDYPRFEEGVAVFLRSVGELRVNTREVSVQVEGDRAVMIVDAEMVFARRDSSGQPETRTSQITFDFQRTPQGWKITEINPRSFFLP